MAQSARWLVVLVVLALTALGAGLGYRRVQARQAAERAQSEARAREAERLQQIEVARAKLPGAVELLAAAMDQHVLPTPEEVDAAARIYDEVAAVDAKAAAGGLALVQGLRSFFDAAWVPAEAAFRRVASGGEEALAKAMLGWTVLRAGGPPTEAWLEFNRALVRRPDFRTALFGRAMADLEGEEERKARDVLSRAVEWWPDRGDVATAYARSLEQTGATNEAIAYEWYRRAVDLGASDPRAVESLVALADQRGDVGAARCQLRGLLENEPERPDLHRALGRAFRLTGDLEAARASLSTSLELDVKSVPTRVELATLYLETLEPQRAADVLGPALGESPHDAQLLGLAGFARRALGDDEGAREAFRESCAGGVSASCEEGCIMFDPESCRGVRPDRQAAVKMELGRMVVSSKMQEERARRAKYASQRTYYPSYSSYSRDSYEPYRQKTFVVGSPKR